MIAFNSALSERDFARIFQGVLTECDEKFGDLACEVAVELAGKEAYGNAQFCEWDGKYPRIVDGKIVRTPAWEEYRRKLQELHGG